jgi:hypothetical protein
MILGGLILGTSDSFFKRNLSGDILTPANRLLYNAAYIFVKVCLKELRGMINVFIDANVWLSLYRFSNDDLEQFRKLRDLVGRDIVLFLPKQVCDEVSRNRDNAIGVVIKEFRTFHRAIPNIFNGYGDYQNLKKQTDDLETLRGSLIKQIEQDAINGTLHADKIINEIFSKVQFFECSEVIFSKAKRRVMVGNPPGKDGKYGDAINWEVLLHYVPDTEDLFFVGEDKHYRSVIGKKAFNPFLLQEWRATKKSELHFFENLTDFLNRHVKTIALRSENEKNGHIAQLQQSVNFQWTHTIIERLNQYASWTSDQIEKLCQIAQDNSQVKWIMGDPDILLFYETILHNYHEELWEENVVWVKNHLAEIERGNDD